MTTTSNEDSRVVSLGPQEDLRHFYATTYGTYHGAFYKPKPPMTITTKKSGYSRNLIPYYLYDKAVDEGALFRDDEHYDTSNLGHYKPPPRPTVQYKLVNTGSGRNIGENGFTRWRSEDGPIFSILDGQQRNSKLEPTSYILGFKTNTAFISDPTRIHNYQEISHNVKEDSLERRKNYLPLLQRHGDIKITRVLPSGYTQDSFKKLCVDEQGELGSNSDSKKYFPSFIEIKEKNSRLTKEQKRLFITADEKIGFGDDPINPSKYITETMNKFSQRKQMKPISTYANVVYPSGYTKAV